MADIDTYEVAATLTDEARKLRAEIRIDEAKLRLKKLEVNKIDHLNSIKKIELECLNLKEEIKKLEEDAKLEK